MAVLKLYYTTQTSTKWELNPANLFVVEDIEDYLLTKSFQTINNFQYQKNALELSFVVDMSQSSAQPKGMQYRYVSIQNSADEGIYYYFVKNVIWRSKSSVRFELIMDVLNTFKEDTAYKFKANTKISREHKDRFFRVQDNSILTLNMSGINEYEYINVDDFCIIKDSELNNLARGKVLYVNYATEIMKIELYNDYGLTEATLPITIRVYKEIEHDDPLFCFVAALIEIIYQNEIFRNVDYINENINPLLQCGNGNGNIIQHDKSLLRQNWYLLYRNANNPDPDDLTNPVECYLIPEDDTDTNAAYIENGRLIASFLEDNKWYVFKLGSGQTATLSNGTTWNGTSNDTYILITKNNDKLAVSLIVTDGGSATATIKANFDEISYITFTSLPIYYHVYTSFPSVGLTFSLLRNEDYDEDFNNTSISHADSIEYLDKSDPKNIKLIKLPYCPYDFSVSANKIVLGTNWELVSISQVGGGLMNAIKLKNLNKKLYTEFVTNYQPLQNLYVGTDTEIDVDINDSRYPISNLPDSKLFHSEFYKPTYVYDSFTYAVQLEKIDTSEFADESDVNTFYIRFDMTSTINSKFMFTFESIELRNAESNFANVMPIARNNEEVLYNVAYINYIKTGYNYDIKNKQISNASNYVGLGLSALSIGASLFAPSVPLKVAGVVGGFVSLAMSIKGTITSTMQNENSIRQKLDQTANQTASVQGSDDVDLMSVYAQNRLKYYVYQPNTVMRSLLNDLFFYAGYKSDRMGLPNHHTRVNFDYLECDANFENLGSIPNDCLQELVNAFKNGVTYLHKTNRVTNKWDFKQEFENWELSLLGE